MRMTNKHLRDPARPFRGKKEPQHSGHLSGVPPRPRRAVNVSIDGELLKVAKEMNINLSQTLERALDRLTAKERAQRFYEEHKEFFDLHNELAEKYGTSSEAYAREFGDGD
jgi:antitoxin CcdA